MLLFTLLLIFLWLFQISKKHQYPHHYPKITVDAGFKYRKKPTWVIKKVIEHKAFMSDAGCRSIATSFNRQFGGRETVSKSWVYNTVKKHRYEILELRKKFKNKRPRVVQLNRFWAMDMSGKFDLDKNNLQILGIIDHGSRASLYLKAIHSKASIHLLRIILDAVEKHGKPQAILTDNEAVFTSKLFKFGLWFLAIKHQCTDVGCPWQNGRVERFFGTLKEKLNQIDVLDFNHLNLHLIDFRFFYNHVRTHQHLDNRTPAEVWTGKGFKRKAKPYSSWGGLLTGFYHRPDG